MADPCLGVVRECPFRGIGMADFVTNAVVVTPDVLRDGSCCHGSGASGAPSRELCDACC